VRRYLGVGLATLGVAVGVFASTAALVSWPSDRTSWWLVFIAVAFISILAGGFANSLSFRDIRSLDRRRNAAVADYLSLRSHLIPLLLEAVDDVLDRRLASLQCLVAPTVPTASACDAPKVYVFMKVDGLHRIVSSTVPASATVRKLALQHDEGVVGFTYDRKAITLTQLSVDHEGEVFNRYGESIGKQRKLRPENLEKCDVGVKWIYAAPIFTSMKHAPWVDQVLGILTVDSLSDEGGKAFEKEAFQTAIDDLSSEVGAYLVALEALRAASTGATSPGANPRMQPTGSAGG